ncbi:MAG: tRNA (adenosine(37)-N6)-threonylcarbamoyltransferase complex ATPase subunit type 1 TsaE [Pseudomonadota bacterium]
MTHSLLLVDADATGHLGARLADAVLTAEQFSLSVALQGDLGAGKSTLTRGFLRAMGHEGPVPSPTYTLLEPYGFKGFTVNHLDLYRLADASELEPLGWRDLDDSIRLVEWPERAAGLLESLDLRITLSWAEQGRQADVVANTSTGQSILRALFKNDHT